MIIEYVVRSEERQVDVPARYEIVVCKANADAEPQPAKVSPHEFVQKALHARRVRFPIFSDR